MKRFFIILVAFTLVFSADAQITTELVSLPDVDDVLTYQTLQNITDEYLIQGEDVTWDFTEMYGDAELLEEYLPASEGADADLFPEADLIIDFAGAAAYAKRNTTNIEVIGLGSGGFIPELDDIESQGLSAPFVTRRAPLGYEDTFSGETDFNFTMWIDPESALGGLIEGFNPFEDSTVDSLKAVFTISRTEVVDSWGTAVFQNGEVPALRLVQNDDINISVELFVNTTFLDTWIDISEFIDPETLGFGDISTTNYVFLGETSQEYLLEVTVDNTTDVPSGRYSSEYYVGINELNSVNVSVYPNPATDEILIDGVKVATVSIRDTAGREVYSGTERVVNISELAAGTYVLSGVSREGQTFVQRISKI